MKKKIGSNNQVVEQEQKQEVIEQQNEIREETIDEIPSLLLQKKRGRKSKREEELEKKAKFEKTLSKETFIHIINTIFEILSKRLGEHWRLTETELELLSSSYYEVLVHYSDKLAENLHIYYALTTTLLVLTPRILYKKKEEKQNEELSGNREKRDR